MKRIKNNDTLLNNKKKKAIDRIYYKYFSVRALKTLKVLKTIKKVLQFLLSLVIVFIVLFAISYFFKTNTHGISDDTITTIAYSFIGMTLTIYVGVVLTIKISLKSNNEYFNQNESKLFFDICFWKPFNNQLLSLYSLVYFATALIYAFTKDFDNSLIYCAGSSISSIILLIRFLIYSNKNKYDRFYYYLKHSNIYYEFEKKDLLSDYSIIADSFIKENKYNLKKITKAAKKRCFYIFVFIKELEEKINRNENVLIEQNILEESFVNISKQIESPIQGFSLLLIVSEYLKCISNCNQSIIKDAKKTKENILRILSYFLQSKSTNYLALHFEIKDFPNLILMTPKSFENMSNEIERIILVQKIYLIILQQYVDIFKEYSLFLKADETDYTKEIDIINEYNSINDSNLSNYSSWIVDSKKIIEKIMREVLVKEK